MIRATRRASMKITANAKAALGFLKIWDLREREGCSFLPDLRAMGWLSFVVSLLCFVTVTIERKREARIHALERMIENKGELPGIWF
jgi:hypothetical protein